MLICRGISLNASLPDGIQIHMTEADGTDEVVEGAEGRQGKWY